MIRKFAALWMVLVFGMAVVVPVTAIFTRAESLSLLTDPIILHMAAMTAFQAFVSSVIAAAIALPLGLWIGSAHGRERRWAQVALALPFGVPTVVAGLSWVVLLGRSGFFSQLQWNYSFKAVILAHVIFNVPWIALWAAQARARVSQSLLDASETMGASPFRGFVAVVWPEIRNAYFGAICQSFVFCAMSFALILILGGGPPVQTLEVMLYSHLRFGTLDMSRASACAIWELIITMIPWALVSLLQSREKRLTRATGTRARGGVFWIRVLFALAFFIPYLSILFSKSIWSADRYIGLSQELIPAISISLELACLSAALALGTAVAAVLTAEQLRGRARDFVVFLAGLPSGISALVLGLGLWLAYGRWMDPFSGSLTAMVALQTVIFFPIAFRVLWPVAQDKPMRLLEAAATLGATPWKSFLHVEWPRWRGPVLSALGMVAGASLGEVAAVSLFYSEKLVPLPLLISRWSSQYRFEDAQAVAVLVLFLCSSVILFASPFSLDEKVESPHERV